MQDKINFWRAVKTEDGKRTYYYNQLTKQSTWSKPADLAEEDKIIRKLKAKERVIATRKVDGTVWFLAVTNLRRFLWYNEDEKMSCWEMPAELSEIVSRFQHQESLKRKTPESDDEILKKSRIEGDEPTEDVYESEPETEQPLIPRVRLSPDKILERQAQFKQLLIDNNVNAFSIYDALEPKIAKDSRFSLVETPVERRRIFDALCLELASMPKEAVPTTSPQDAFIELLQSDVTKHKMVWAEFKMIYKKDKRFQNMELKHAEKLFKDHISKLKYARSAGRSQ